MNQAQALEKEIKELEERLKDRELALPAHSIRASQLLLIEELEEDDQREKETACGIEEVWGHVEVLE